MRLATTASPTLKKNLFHNGKIVDTRGTIVIDDKVTPRLYYRMDFGYVALDIRRVQSEDKGNYTFHFIDLTGEAATTTTTLDVI